MKSKSRTLLFLTRDSDLDTFPDLPKSRSGYHQWDNPRPTRISLFWIGMILFSLLHI